MSIRVLLADDHTIMREGLRSILENELHLEVVAQADDGRAAVELAGKLKPDLVIMDVSMPDLNGIEATRRILAADPRTKVIALSMHADKRYVGEMLGAGVSGYLLKHSAMDELQQAIHTVMANKKYISPEIAGVVIDDYLLHLSTTEGGAPPEQLTPREREVLQLIAEGKSTKEIASLLHVSVPTIDTHRQHIMDKLQIFSVADLTKYAIRTGLTSLDS
jgi:DNA-binding NarL/FixJ family response regulator